MYIYIFIVDKLVINHFYFVQDEPSQDAEKLRNDAPVREQERGDLVEKGGMIDVLFPLVD